MTTLASIAEIEAQESGCLVFAYFTSYAQGFSCEHAIPSRKPFGLDENFADGREI
jgi:hypothetical protein